jgi:hypothetical protein
MARPETCQAPREKQRTPPARLARSRMWPPTNWVQRHTRSGLRARRCQTANATRPVAASAGGSALAFPLPYRAIHDPLEHATGQAERNAGKSTSLISSVLSVARVG